MKALVERMEQLKATNSSLNTALQNTWRLLPYNPETAYSEFIRITEQFQALSQEWEEWLLEFEVFNDGNNKDCRYQTESILRQMEQFLAQGKGVALALLGRLAEAQKAYERSITILGNNSSPSYASLAEALGQLALQQAIFDEAEQQFRLAYDAHFRFAVPEAWNDIVDPKVAHQSSLLSLEGAARVLESLAQVDLHRGNREAFLQRQLKAIEFANTHHVSRLARNQWLTLYSWQLQWDVRGAFSDALEQKLKVLERNQEDWEQGSFEIDKLFLEAENHVIRGSRSGAKILLNKAKEILEKNQHLLDKWWKLYMAFARYHEWQDEIEPAIENAGAALEIAKEIGVPDLIQQAIDTLVRISNIDKTNPEHQLRARHHLDDAIDMLRNMEAGEALAQSLIQRSIIYHLPEQQLKTALVELKEAEAYVKSRDLRQLLLSAQAAARKMSGKKVEALRTLQSAIQLCHEQMLPVGQPSARNYRDLLYQTELLHEGAALLAAEVGRAHEAFDFAEKGKTLLLRQQLAQSGINPQDDAWHIPKVSYGEKLQQSMKEESAAFLFFCVGTGRTLALLLDPFEAAPKPFFVGLEEKDLEETKLSKGLWPSSCKSQNDFIKFLSILSDKLLTPLAKVLQDVMNRCEVLYIVPDSRLYLVPFSALTLNGIPLVEHPHCAIALTPSVALWQWCRRRRLVDDERSCLVVGTGKVNEFSFADQARAIMMGCNWKKAPTYLLDDEVTVTGESIWQMAKRHTVLHFSCHGLEEPDKLNTLSALHLILSNNEKWYAKDVFNHKNELTSELVFLNACMSGRFRLQEGVSIGGFWEGFLHAGTTSIIATLAEVHPEDAEELSRSFYHTWLKGNVTKARALQLAQQELRLKKPNSFQWARYILIGDHR